MSGEDVPAVVKRNNTKDAIDGIQVQHWEGCGYGEESRNEKERYD
jgi:hypothetical protein